jgi:hypothetical protein
MGLGEGRASSYRERAAEMRRMAEYAQSEELRASFLRLEASWLRLAEAVDKADEAEDPAPMPPPENDNDSTSPRPN